MENKIKSIIFTFTAFLCSQAAISQVNNNNINGADDGPKMNTITTAVPFLLISPDSRAGGMGDAGVATSPDINSIHWNPSKLAFADKEMGLSVSYTPWLKQLVNDIALSYLSGYKRIDELTVIGGSLSYFTLGDIQFTDVYGNETMQFRPNEFSLDVSLARKLSDRFSGGLAVRYINSNLTGGTNVQGADTKPGRAVAVDVSAYYQNSDIEIGQKPAEFAAGINISNIGNKMSYSSTSNRDFLPINLRLGPRLTMNLDEYNSISFTTDFNKLLVPTLPEYEYDSTGQPVVENGNPKILSGKDPNRPVTSGIFGSFSDAPGTPVKDDNGNPLKDEEGNAMVEKGSVFNEELREINYAIGMEYWYDNQFAVRAGYFWEHETKGNRKFLTLGAGLKYKVFGLDFSYLIPTYFGTSNRQTSPLANTLRFSLTFDFESFKDQKEAPIE